MSFLDKKITEIEDRIKLINQHVKQLEQFNGTLLCYTDFLRKELDSINEDLEKVKTRLDLMRKWYPHKEQEILPDLRSKLLLTTILRELIRIESEFYFQIDLLVPSLRSWIYQKDDPEIAFYHKLLTGFIDSLIRHMGLEEHALSIFRDAYTCHSCFIKFRQLKGHVISLPFSELLTLRRWPISAHEVGHAYYDVHFRDFESQLFPLLKEYIIKLRPELKRETERAVNIWIEHWVPELAADCVAVKALGPSFVIQFLSDALHFNPMHVDLFEPTHPPTKLRVNFQLEALKTLDLSGFDVNSLSAVWDSFTHNTVYKVEPFVEYLLSPEIVEEARKTNNLIREMPIKERWSEILNSAEALSKNQWIKTDLLTLMCAIGLLPPSYNIEWIFKSLREEGF